MSIKVSDAYREHAERERALAASSTLEQAAIVHLRAAEKWDQLAAQAARLEASR